MNIVLSVLSIAWMFIILLTELLFIISLFIRKKVSKTTKIPTVSFVVAVWNESLRIGKCIESLLNQKYPKDKLEIIVIGGGNDNTSFICQQYQKKGKIIFLQEKVRKGKWFSLNRGIKMAKNKIIAFTDADCVLPTNWLTHLVSRLNDGDIIVSPYVYSSTKTFVHKMSYITTLVLNSLMTNLSKIFKLSRFFGFGCLMKRTVLKKIKFKKSFIEDLLFSYEAQKQGFKIIVDAEVRPIQANPNRLSDIEQFMRRSVPAVLKEITKIQDFTSFFTLGYSSLSIISLPIWPYFLFTGNKFVILMTLVFLLISFVIYLLILITEKRLSKLHYFPLLILSVFVYTSIGIKELIASLFNKNKSWDYVWPIYNKAE